MVPRVSSPGRVLARLRRICLSLPETHETPTWGHPNFRVGKKIFAAFHQDPEGSPCIWVKLGPVGRDVVRGDPRFSPSRHGGGHWAGLRADLPLDWDVVRGLVVESYRAIAPRRCVRALEQRDGAAAAR